jgi:hypothetical protein
VLCLADVCFFSVISPEVNTQFNLPYKEAQTDISLPLLANAQVHSHTHPERVNINCAE